MTKTLTTSDNMLILQFGDLAVVIEKTKVKESWKELQEYMKIYLGEDT